MTSSILSRGQPQRNSFVPATPRPSGEEQGRILFQLGFSIGACATDEQTHGWLAEEAAHGKGERKAVL